MAERNKKVKICVITTVGLSLDKLFPDFYPILIEKGYEIVGICAEDKYAENVRRQRVRVITVPMTRDFSPIQDLRCFWKLYRIFRHENFDLIHYSTPKASLLAAIAGRLVCCPALLYTVRGLGYTAFSGMKRFVGKLCEKIACHCAHYVIVIAPSLKEEAVRENLLPAVRMNVLGIGSSKGVNIDRFQVNKETITQAKKVRQDLGINANDIVIGYVGRLTEDKNLGELLEAFCNIYSRNKSVYMFFVGDQDQRNPLPEKIAVKIKTHPGIHTFPFQEQIENYIATMDIFVLPSASYREGFGNVLIEASAMEKPVIATNLAGSRSAVVNNVTGILVDKPDTIYLEEALNELIKNRPKRIEMGRNGKQWVTKNFDRKVVWGRLIKVYEQMLY